MCSFVWSPVRCKPAGDASSEDEDQHGSVRSPNALRKSHAAREQHETGRDCRRNHGQDGKREGEAPALVRGAAELGELGRQTRGLVRAPYGQRRPGRDDEHRRHELEPPRVDSDGHGEAGGERQPASSPEGEVENRDEEHEARRRERPEHDPVSARREPHRHDDPDDDEDRDRVPVAERIRKAVAGEGVERADSIGEESRRQRVGRDRHDSCEERGQEEREATTAEHGERERERDVHERALDLVHRLGRRR